MAIGTMADFSHDAQANVPLHAMSQIRLADSSTLYFGRAATRFFLSRGSHTRTTTFRLRLSHHITRRSRLSRGDQ
jgi:hypothetical protein